MFKILRWLLGTIISSIGILLNEAFNLIPHLTEFASIIVETLERHTYFKIPRIEGLKTTVPIVS